ncbi:MAG: hypothetical protein JJ958_09615 [Balneola sp.]|nr:hypothetical protein [Balneola sp.]
MNNYRALILSFMIISCSSPDPERVKNQVLSTSCKEVKEIELIYFADNRNKEIKIIDADEVCEIFTLLKEKSSKPHLEYLPTNTNIDSFVMLVFGNKKEEIFQIQSGIFKYNKGYIILMNSEVGIVDMRLISDLEFPLKMLEIIEEKR